MNHKQQPFEIGMWRAVEGRGPSPLAPTVVGGVKRSITNPPLFQRPLPQQLTGVQSNTRSSLMNARRRSSGHPTTRPSVSQPQDAHLRSRDASHAAAGPTYSTILNMARTSLEKQRDLVALKHPPDQSQTSCAFSTHGRIIHSGKPTGETDHSKFSRQTSPVVSSMNAQPSASPLMSLVPPRIPKLYRAESSKGAMPQTVQPVTSIPDGTTRSSNSAPGAVQFQASRKNPMVQGKQIMINAMSTSMRASAVPTTSSWLRPSLSSNGPPLNVFSNEFTPSSMDYHYVTNTQGPPQTSTPVIPKPMLPPQPQFQAPPRSIYPTHQPLFSARPNMDMHGHYVNHGNRPAETIQRLGVSQNVDYKNVYRTPIRQVESVSKPLPLDVQRRVDRVTHVEMNQSSGNASQFGGYGTQQIRVDMTNRMHANPTFSSMPSTSPAPPAAPVTPSESMKGVNKWMRGSQDFPSGEWMDDDDCLSSEHRIINQVLRDQGITVEW